MKVVFICGAGRSGTTIFGKVISHVLEAFNVGEMIYLRSRSIDRDQLCGCGRKFSECEFWPNVLQADPEFSENARIVESHARWRYLPLFMASLLGLKNRHTFRAARALEKMYTAVAAQSETQVIVDTSKTIPYAFLLMNTGLEVDFFLIVRNIRDVVKSTQRMKFIPELGREDRLHKRSSSFYFLQWLLIVSFQVLIRAIRQRSILVSYNHYVSDHVRINGHFWPNAAPIDFSDAVQVEQQHDVAGNPSRFGRSVKLKKV